MDTSETYIKMCDCPEIQGLWSPEVADWYWNKHGVIDWVRSKRITDRRRKHHSKYDYNQEPNFTWLPRQDQLQEMVVTTPDTCWFKLSKFDEWRNGLDWGFGEEIPLGLRSMEQLWLAFAMQEKFGKVWTGDKWGKMTFEEHRKRAIAKLYQENPPENADDRVKITQQARIEAEAECIVEEGLKALGG